ncbi:hypothetical protein [Tateyamaria pelophila]|uniref:hypothetical protein n=1 Tax=Tateyamaria pelophila TaxID=328415 RepID=UPI001CBC7E58|nr:hypothetical protein [Tateyamaria pelophila]
MTGAEDSYDDETPMEETPGYVGHIFDDFIDFDEGLKPLEGFDFSLYGIMADELGASQRPLELDFGNGPTSVSFEAYSLNEIVEIIPAVEAIYDCPPNQGPAGGSGYIFVLREGFTIEQSVAAAKSLRSALDSDFSVVEAAYEKI